MQRHSTWSLGSQFVLNGSIIRDNCDGLMLAICNGLVLEVDGDLCLMELSMTGCRQRVAVKESWDAVRRQSPDAMMYAPLMACMELVLVPMNMNLQL